MSGYTGLYASLEEEIREREKMRARACLGVTTGGSLNDWARKIHLNAQTHGWWDAPRSFGEIVALCHSELSEALEEYRNGRPLAYVWQQEDEDDLTELEPDMSKWQKGKKPEGVAVEMIDCIIRILDWCGKEGVDVDALLALKHEYNGGRPYKHGGKVI